MNESSIMANYGWVMVQFGFEYCTDSISRMEIEIINKALCDTNKP